MAEFLAGKSEEQWCWELRRGLGEEEVWCGDMSVAFASRVWGARGTLAQ